MKTYIKIFVSLILFQNVACVDLDRNPLDQISSQTFWTSQADVDMALAGVYVPLFSSSYNYNLMKMEAFGGDAYTSGDYMSPAQGLIYSTSTGPILSMYTDCYKGIAACHFFLDNIDRASVSDQIKNKYKGEARFLRALHYFNLSEYYGGVPLYTKLVTLEESKIAKSTKDQVVAQVLQDLDFAIANLPNTTYTGHAVKGTALTLKAKVLLHNGKFKEAADAAAQVIADGKFSISNNFSTMFLTSGQTNNPEIMFSTQFLNPDRTQAGTGPDVEYLWWGVINPRQNFVDEFECIDGQPISTSPLYDSKDMKKNRDPRLAMTVKTFAEPTIKSDGTKVVNTYNGPSQTGWEPLKGCNADNMPVDYAVKSDQDWVLLRYAETLLIYAEAQNEAVGPDESVYKAINTVRARPGVNMPPVATGLSKDQMRTRIMHERRVEFGLEGKRYLDIKRWKTIETIIPTIVDAGGIKSAFDPKKNYVFPFPQSEIDINKKLVQNPNY